MKIYHTATQEDYDALMIYFEKKGFKWLRGEKPTRFDRFKDNGKDTCVYEEDGIISFSGVEYFKKYHGNETLIEYKVKGENMTEEEMKHNLQEVAKLYEVASDVTDAIGTFVRGTLTVESDLQEAKSSAKKLIEKIDEYFESQKPEFKVGDYVTVDVNGNGRKKIAKIDALRENKEEAHGLWYDKTKVNVKQDYWFLAELNEFRHARPTEIVEYESALTFHKHGRKPFEVKDGDILRDDEGNIFSVNVPGVWNKENFTSGDYTFLKTAEEVGEWLGE